MKSYLKLNPLRDLLFPIPRRLGRGSRAVLKDVAELQTLVIGKNIGELLPNLGAQGAHFVRGGLAAGAGLGPGGIEL